MSTATRFIRPTKIPSRPPPTKHAHHLFDELPPAKNLFSPSEHLRHRRPTKNLSSLNSHLAAHLRSNNPLSTWYLFLSIHRSRTDLTSPTFTPVLGACSALPNPLRGQQVHTLMVKYSSDTEIIPQTALMGMYSDHGLMVESSRVFSEMGCRDVAAWNAMISGLLRHGMAGKAISVFEEMRRGGVGFNGFTLCPVIKACVSLNDVRKGVQVHRLVVAMGSGDSVVLGTALIDFYSHFGMMDDVVCVYESMGHDKDEVMRNSFIAACVRNGRYGEAMLVMSTMRPNTFALTSALVACSESSDLLFGKQLHSVAIRFGLFGDTHFCNALLDMYAKCGAVSSAGLVFDRMCQRDVVSWTSMIDAHGANGNGVKAVELYKKMGGEGNRVVPNDITVLAVLSACSRSGLVVQGRECLQLAQEKYGFTPGSKHYACYIDILGRAGHVEEIWTVYEDMVKNETELTGEIWAALMNAFGQNNDILRGEFAARNLYELEPDKPGTYTLLSNFYAAVGKWDIVDQLRSVMKGKGLLKNVGISWVSASHSELDPSLLLG